MKTSTAEWTEMAATGETVATTERVKMVVEIKLTGHVGPATDTHRTEFTLEGETLRTFPKALLAVYDVRDLVIAECEVDTTMQG